MSWKALICAAFIAFAPQTPPPQALPFGRPSVALVLAGGGAKGYAHIPVLELIEELDIPVDMVIGTSAGAIVGGLYCAGYSPQMLKEILFNLDWNAIFQDRPAFAFERQLGEHSFERNPVAVKFSRKFALSMGRGFSSGQEAYKLFRSLTAKIPSYIDFDSLPIPFRAAGVELTTGKLEFFHRGILPRLFGQA
jgi:NTE family protein